MNRSVLAVSTCLVLIAFAAIQSQAQTDLNTRKAMYFTGTKTDAIDLKGDVYVAGGATLSLSAELRTSCDNNICEFNAGIIATRTGTGPLTTEVLVQVEKGSGFTKTFTFAAGEMSKEVILPI